MADMATVDALIEEKRKYPNAAVVCYINTSAAVKAECDICCTSSNAVRVIRSIPNDEVLFVPDQNLGSFVAGQVPDKKIHLWSGYCITHHRVSREDVEKAKAFTRMPWFWHIPNAERRSWYGPILSEVRPR